MQPTSHTCFTTCPDGFYTDTTTNKCLPCNAICPTCFGPLITNCYTCTGDYYLQISITTCDKKCPGGTFKDTASKTCSPCIGCNICGTTATDCLNVIHIYKFNSARLIHIWDG